VARIVAETGILVYKPDNVNHPLWVERINSLKPDVIFSFYYRNPLSIEILRIAPHGAFSLHGSLLPKYLGSAPLNWVLTQRETGTGVNLHQMVKKPDAGAIVGQIRMAISPEDMALSLHNKLCNAVQRQSPHLKSPSP